MGKPPLAKHLVALAALQNLGAVTSNLLFALDGALRGNRWDHLPRRVRERLKAAVLSR